MITGDFDCRNSNWYLGDPVTPQGTPVEALTSFYCWNQLIKTSTHLLQNSATRIDLVFTNQPHLVMEGCVSSSLVSTCHHEIILAKLNLKVEYPPFYERVFWDSSSPGKVSINWAINAIDWEKLFPNKPVESRVSEVNNLLLNIYSNYIPNKIVLCEDKDPPWLANWIRAVIKMKNDAYKEYIRSSMRHNYYVRLENLTTELSNLIRYSKTEYHSELAAKLLINNEFISNFKTKANYFNRLFIQQCTAISTDSSIPSSVNLAINETVTKINLD